MSVSRASDARLAQQSGWVSRIFDSKGREQVKVTTLPEATCAEERVVGVWVPARNEVSEKGVNLLTAMLGRLRCRWEWWDPDRDHPYAGVVERDKEPPGQVYRVVVGKAAITSWVDLTLEVMAGRIAYNPNTNRVVCVIHHPDSILAANKDRKKHMIDLCGAALDDFGKVARGEQSAVDLIARDCVACAAQEHPETATRWHVTEIDRNGLGLCRVHSGYDLRPEGQRFVQEGLFS